MAFSAILVARSALILTGASPGDKVWAILLNRLNGFSVIREQNR